MQLKLKPKFKPVIIPDYTAMCESADERQNCITTVINELNNIEQEIKEIRKSIKSVARKK